MPLVMVHGAPKPEFSPAPDPLLVPIPEPKDMVIPEVPVAMSWLGSIGGVLGIISFTESTIRRIVGIFKKKKPKKKPEEKQPSWLVGLAIGLDGHGLKVNPV